MSSRVEPGTVPPRGVRQARGRAVAEAFEAVPMDTPEADEQARQWLATLNPRSHVGSLHHTVPRFLLQRWARDAQLRVYSRVDRAFSARNVNDLGVKDFYTFVDLAGALDSSFESLLGQAEAPAAATIARLLSPFTRTAEVTTEELFQLAQLMAFQVVRTTRRRREMELQAEWCTKTMASGRMTDAELREISVVPHQNDSLNLSFSMAHQLVPFIACRPLALIVLDERDSSWGTSRWSSAPDPTTASTTLTAS